MERKKSISLCMIVKNEEKYLEKCLKSVVGLVDEMIIVDTGSVDRTIEIAKAFGARVLVYQWDNNFSNARNYALQFAGCDWILLMDGDDEFDREDEDKFIDLVNTSAKDGHYFRTLSYVGNAVGKDVVTNLNLRLLRNSKKYKYVFAIHEQITHTDGKMDYSKFSTENIRIFHYGYLNKVASEKDKRTRNISILQEELKNNPNNQFNLFNMANEYYALGDREKALELFDKVYKIMDFREGFAAKLVIRRVICLDELTKYNDALHAIEEGLKKYSEFTDLEFTRACIYLKQRKYTLAIDSFKRCIELGNPPIHLEFLNDCGTYRAYQGLGEIYLTLQDYDKALANLDMALKYDAALQDPLYKIGTILNRIYENKRYVSFKLSQYFDLELPHDLIFIAKILMQEALYDIAMGYLEKAQESDEYNDEVSVLMGRILFYQRKYNKSDEIFSNTLQDSDLNAERLRYVFIKALKDNAGAADIEKILKEPKACTDDLLYKTYYQIYNVYMGRKDVIFKEQDDHERILEISMSILEEVLKIQEFDLFEKLLEILNCIESKRVLLELAKLYDRHEFKYMAVEEILRSIKELNTVDREGIEILYKRLC